MEKTKKEKKARVDIRFKELNGGRKSIYLDIYLNSKHTYEFLKLYLVPELTPADERQNKKVMKQAEAVARLRRKEWNTVEVENKHINGELVEAKSKKDKLLLDWLDEFEQIQLQKGVKYKKAYQLLKHVVGKYDDKARMSNVDLSFCVGFIEFMKRDYVGLSGRKPASKTLFGYLCTFTNALNTAVRYGLLPSNPLNGLRYSEKIHVKEAPRDFLTIDELKLMIATPVRKPCHEICKQAYLFSCNCGLRYGDIVNLKWKDIYMEKDKWMLATTMQKSERPVYIPLGVQALRWLPEKGDAKPDDSVFVMPNLDTTNRVLAQMAEYAGIKKHVTFHTARHTFATMLITLDVDIYTTSKLLGHSDVRITERYAKIVDQRKDAAVSLLDTIE